MRVTRRGVLTVLVGAMAAVMAAGPVPASGQGGGPEGPPAHARVLARIGQSGLRSLLSASGGLGDLQNRAGSYRMAAQLERSRVGHLEGRIEALGQALTDPTLGDDERAAITALRDEARAELTQVPGYEAAYGTATVQAEGLIPFGFVSGHPLFLLARTRGHLRGGGDDGLTVLSEGASVGPVVVVSERWVVSPGLGLGRTDVTIEPFDGSSASTSVGPRLDLGLLLGRGWSLAAQVGHSWSWNRSEIVRPGPDGGTRVRTAGWSTVTSAKGELKGTVSMAGPLTVRPRLGTFVVTSRSPATADGPSEAGTGPFGERETYAAVRLGAGVSTRSGAWTPALYVGWERELTDDPSGLVRDPNAALAAAGLGWSWAPGRRLSVEGTLVRGLNGQRRASELTLVVILDG